MELAECRAGETPWRILIFAAQIWITMCACLEFSTATEVHIIFKALILGREVALYVKDRFIDELKKLDSYKAKDYSKALREVFIKMDDMLLTPQGKKDITKYSASQDESQSSLFGRPETDNIALYTGCTACVVLISDTDIYCANAGTIELMTK